MDYIIYVLDAFGVLQIIQSAFGAMVVIFLVLYFIKRS